MANPQSPLLFRARPALVTLQGLVKSKVEHLFRNSRRYGFDPAQGPGVEGHVKNNTLYLAINPARHLSCRLERGAEPRVELGALAMGYGKDVDAHVWISADRPSPGEAFPAAPEFREIGAHGRLAARMNEVRQNSGNETIGMSCDLSLANGFLREASVLSVDMVQFRA